jgi:hypothetical protein
MPTRLLQQRVGKIFYMLVLERSLALKSRDF